MPKYKCTNSECSEFDKIDNVYSTKIVIENGTAIDKNSFCPICGLSRDVVRESGMTTMIAGTNDQRNRMAKQW